MSGTNEDIEIDGADGGLTAYFALPPRPGPVSVVVLQEIFGVNANIRAICDRYAAAGFAAVAPDLFWRQERGVQLDPGSDEGRQRAMVLMKDLDRDQAVADGKAALATLAARVPGIERTAAVGYCFGGGVAFLMTCRGVCDAGVAYYGTGLTAMLGELDHLRGRLLLHIAGDDALCPPEAQAAIAAAATATGGRAEVVVHPGVGHAFARIGGATFDAAAASRADAATMALLTALG